MSDKALPVGERSGKSAVITRQHTIDSAIMLQAGNLCKNTQYYGKHGMLPPEEEHNRQFDDLCKEMGVGITNPLGRYTISLREYLANVSAACEVIISRAPLNAKDAARVRTMAKAYATGTWNDLPDHNKETE